MTETKRPKSTLNTFTVELPADLSERTSTLTGILDPHVIPGTVVITLLADRNEEIQALGKELDHFLLTVEIPENLR